MLVKDTAISNNLHFSVLEHIRGDQSWSGGKRDLPGRPELQDNRTPPEKQVWLHMMFQAEGIACSKVNMARKQQVKGALF